MNDDDSGEDQPGVCGSGNQPADHLPGDTVPSARSPDVANPLHKLGEAVDRLRQMEHANVPAEEVAAMRNVVALYDGILNAFTATRELVAVRRGQGDDGVPSGITVRDRREIGDEAVENLTACQREVLKLLQAGASNRDIADELGISEGTVKLHVSAILGTLGVKNRAMAAAYPMPAEE